MFAEVCGFSSSKWAVCHSRSKTIKSTAAGVKVKVDNHQRLSFDNNSSFTKDEAVQFEMPNHLHELKRKVHLLHLCVIPPTDSYHGNHIYRSWNDFQCVVSDKNTASGVARCSLLKLIRPSNCCTRFTTDQDLGGHQVWFIWIQKVVAQMSIIKLKEEIILRSFELWQHREGHPSWSGHCFTEMKKKKPIVYKKLPGRLRVLQFLSLHELITYMFINLSLTHTKNKLDFCFVKTLSHPGRNYSSEA